MKKVDRDIDLAVPIWTTYRDLLYLKGSLKSKKDADRFDLVWRDGCKGCSGVVGV